MTAKTRVLIVDDSQQMVDTVSQYLASYGFEAVTKTNPAEALDTFHKVPVQAVLTDLRMNAPDGLDGLDILDEIHRTNPSIPVIIMTAFGSIENAVEAVHRGAYNYLTKPFALGALRAMLNRAIGSGPSQPTVAASTEILRALMVAAPVTLPAPTSATPESHDPVEALVPHAISVRELQERYIAAVLRSVGGNRTRAARILGIDPSTLYRREIREKE